MKIDNIPESFCFVRMNTNAKQKTPAIRKRKDDERKSQNNMDFGLFYWGFSSLSGKKSICKLAEILEKPMILFAETFNQSEVDQDSEIAKWVSYKDDNGKIIYLPDDAIITVDKNKLKTRKNQYALVCYSNESILSTDSNLKLYKRGIKNYCRDTVMCDQNTTCAVTYSDNITSGSVYPIKFTAELRYPYVIELAEYADYTYPDN